MTPLLFLAVPLALLFVAKLYASANSNTSQTTAEALVRWLHILAWFAESLASGADWALNNYRRRRWSKDRQPECESNRPWEALAEPEQPEQIERVPLLAQLKAWRA